MNSLHNLTISNRQPRSETLRINRTDSNVSSTAKILRFRDEDTRQIVYYIPSLELTSYGSTEKKAFEMLRSSLNGFFGFLNSLSESEMIAELAKLGWTQKERKHREFSRAFIDSNGDLKEFNAVSNKIESLIVEV